MNDSLFSFYVQHIEYSKVRDMMNVNIALQGHGILL
ncbi:unnamed protein product [Brassica napus]|uniref:(rape) hypothetical protein n=1 Tax=Brassica napus TaxID=3708 RepID=A0A816V5W0_BRANA|nr:unnamed protein product [Brassica napus]